jgi:hypothetical protein
MDVSPVRPRSLARMTHLARRVAAACHDLAFGVEEQRPWRTREPGTRVAPPG